MEKIKITAIEIKVVASSTDFISKDLEIFVHKVKLSSFSGLEKAIIKGAMSPMPKISRMEEVKKSPSKNNNEPLLSPII